MSSALSGPVRGPISGALKGPTLALLGALVLAGCPGQPCPSQPFSSAEDALSAYRDMRRPARVIRAQTSVDRRDSEGRIRGTVRMYIERPNRVRFDAMTQFGPAAILTSDGETFSLMDLRENRFFEGPTCPANIERLLGLRFSGAEVTRMLLGETPRLEDAERTIECQGSSYLVTLNAADGRRQELTLAIRSHDVDEPPGQQRMRLMRSEVFDSDGQTVWRVTYDDYRFVADPLDTHSPQRGLVLPYSVNFVEPARGTDTLVRFEEIELNVAVPEGTFSQRARPGLSVESVSCD